MKIIECGRIETFKDVKIGEVFKDIDDNLVYIKIENTAVSICGYDTIRVNALRFEDTNLMYFEDDYTVEAFNAELVLKS